MLGTNQWQKNSCIEGSASASMSVLRCNIYCCIIQLGFPDDIQLICYKNDICFGEKRWGGVVQSKTLHENCFVLCLVVVFTPEQHFDFFKQYISPLTWELHTGSNSAHTITVCGVTALGTVCEKRQVRQCSVGSAVSYQRKQVLFQEITGYSVWRYQVFRCFIILKVKHVNYLIEHT